MSEPGTTWELVLSAFASMLGLLAAFVIAVRMSLRTRDGGSPAEPGTHQVDLPPQRRAGEETGPADRTPPLEGPTRRSA